MATRPWRRRDADSVPRYRPQSSPRPFHRTDSISAFSLTHPGLKASAVSAGLQSGLPHGPRTSRDRGSSVLITGMMAVGVEMERRVRWQRVIKWTGLGVGGNLDIDSNAYGARVIGS